MRLAFRRTAAFIAIVLCFLPMVVATQWLIHAYEGEFGGTPDEASHYVTGLMVRDYTASFFHGSPMRYAESYYVHYPKVAFGHWPPVFYLIQAVWMLIFPASHGSALALMAVLTAILCALVAWTAARYFGMPIGIAAGVVFLCLPIVQLHASMVMAELPLALFALLATLSFAAYLKENRWSDSIWFGVWASMAILTKGSAYALAVMALLSLLLTRQIHRIKELKLWLSAAIVAVSTIPFTILTMRMNRDGWDSPRLFDPDFTIAAIRRMSVYLVDITGVLLFAAIVAGVVGLAMSRAAVKDPFWASLISLTVAVYIFNVTVPVAIEPRYHFIALPALILIATAGVTRFSEFIPRLRKEQTTIAVLLLLGIGPALRATQTIQRTRHGFRDVARLIAASPELRNQPILVSTSGRTLTRLGSEDRGDPEGMFIAEVASLDAARPSVHVVRASKQFARSGWNDTDYKLLCSTPEAISDALDQIPVSVLVLHTVAPNTHPRKYHHDVLLDMLRRQNAGWREIYRAPNSQSVPGQTEDISVYMRNAPVPPARQNIQVDLSNKLNRVVHENSSTDDGQPKRGTP